MCDGEPPTAPRFCGAHRCVSAAVVCAGYVAMGVFLDPPPPLRDIACIAADCVKRCVGRTAPLHGSVHKSCCLWALTSVLCCVATSTLWVARCRDFHPKAVAQDATVPTPVALYQAECPTRTFNNSRVANRLVRCLLVHEQRMNSACAVFVGGCSAGPSPPQRLTSHLHARPTCIGRSPSYRPSRCPTSHLPSRPC